MNTLTRHNTVVNDNAVVDVAESKVLIATTSDIVSARQYGRKLAEVNHFTKSQQTRFATAISELTRNVLTYAVQGECLFSVTRNTRQVIVTAIVVDKGPGIENIELALQDGFSGGHGLGLGLPGAKRLVDLFAIESKPGLTSVQISIVRQNVLRRN